MADMKSRGGQKIGAMGKGQREQHQGTHGQNTKSPEGRHLAEDAGRPQPGKSANRNPRGGERSA
jgi:hypothetical protein